MKYVFIIAAFNALFFAVLLLQKKPKALNDRILFYWLIYLGIFTALYAFSDKQPLVGIKHIPVFIISMFLLHGPFLYLYVASFASANRKFSQSAILHFVPFFSFLLYLIVSLAFPDYAERIRMDHVTIHEKPPVIFVMFLIITALSGPVYFAIAFMKIKQIKNSILNNFSTTLEINLSWLKTLINIFGIIWSALIVIAIIHHIFHYFSMDFCTDGLFLSLSIFIILLGYFGLRQKEIFTRFSSGNIDFLNGHRAKYQNIPISDLETAEYISRINLVIETNKPYLNPDLTLPSLASMVEMPSYQLSRIINEKFGCNFFDFINAFRVNEVKARLSDPTFDKLSMLGLAFDCGFNSKSAFNRIFKKMTGFTPTEYKNSLAG